jgi:hypothetical protein
MHLPKVTITKKFLLTAQGHYRWYSPLIDMNHRFPKSIRPKMPTFDLDSSPSNYPHISVKTEKELCYFIYKNYGTGEYRLLGHLLGRKGTWTFWKGEINDEGFTFERRDMVNTREINKLKRELGESEDEEEKQYIKDDIELEKELGSYAKYGFIPFLIPSGRRGELVLWTDEDLPQKLIETEEDKIVKKTKQQREEEPIW